MATTGELLKAHQMRLTKPLHMVPADQRTAKAEERLVDVGPPLVAHLQPPVTVQPRQSPLHHPTVAAQLLARLKAAPGNARGDPLFLSALRQRGKS